ncbi:MAG: Crp/Fnr family transcriptional regulator [Deltaproteobacteria bacterium]|nr:Crp/Fnr family transcriptional regulator [Deltaproteobacteria bacterium]
MSQAEEKRTAQILRKCPVLVDAPADVLARLAASAQTQSYRARQVVYLPGDRAASVHFLASGRVKVSKVTRDGKELTLAYRSSGEFFGETCLLEGGPREEMVEAMESTTTIEVDRALLDHILSSHAEVAYPFARALVGRWRSLQTKVEQLVFKDVGSKLAELLLRLGSEHGVEHRRGLVLGLKITHQEMANLIGSTRETVSLTLSQFKRKGYITTEGRRVILTDREALRSLV